MFTTVTSIECASSCISNGTMKLYYTHTQSLIPRVLIHIHYLSPSLSLFLSLSLPLSLSLSPPPPPPPPLIKTRPTEFLPLEYSGIRGIEQKMYKEQEILKMKNHKDIKAAYNTHCSKLPTYETVFFPARVSQL